MDIRHFGTSGLYVSALGYGAGTLGADTISEKEAEALLRSVLDSGITLIDTARGYGLSEERIGKYLSKQRDRFVLSTKVGYGVPDVADWTYEAVVQGVDLALKTLKTEYIDIVHLHSCPKDTLQYGDVIPALHACKNAGKIRAAAYSGEHEALHFAVESNSFDGFQSSINVCDQRTITYPLPIAKMKGMGVIAKRPAANAPWRFSERPVGHYGEEYWHRWKTMNVQTGLNPTELALRFAAFTWGVDSIIVGTTNLDHLKYNVSCIEKGPLPGDTYNYVREMFHRHDQNWYSQL